MFRSSSRHRRTALFVVLCATIGAAPGLARASDDDPEALITRGVELRREHHDAEALALFERAYGASRSPRARAQIALAEQALDRWLEAEAHLDEALASDGDAWVKKNRLALEEALRVIRQHLGWLAVEGDVAGAELFVNGRRIGTMPQGKLRVPAGEVNVEARLAGYAPAVRSTKVFPGTVETVHLAMGAKLPASERAADRAGDASPDGTRRTAGWLVGGAGVVLLGVGTVFGVRALGFEADRDELCDASGCSSQAGIDAHRDARTNAWISTVTMGVGVIGLAAGAWLVLTAPSGKQVAVTWAPHGVVLRGSL